MKSILGRLTMICVLMILIQGCASKVGVMMPAADIPRPDESHAVVTFLRPSKFAFAVHFGIWDKQNLVGVLSARSSISIRTEPGEHLFLAKAENWAIVKADLAPGKQYFILARPRMGLAKAGVIMDPIKADTTDAKLAEWKQNADPKMTDPAQVEAYVAKWLPHVKTAIQNYEDGRAAFNVLEATDGR